MNLFAIGWSTSRAADPAPAGAILADLVTGMPFFTAGARQDWRSADGRVAVAAIAHASADGDPGTGYLHLEDRRMALFSGRPIAWTSDASADGRGPAEASFYLRPAREWSDALDGRCVVARYDADAQELEVYVDPLGAYPVYRAGVPDGFWISNSAQLLSRLTGRRELEPGVVASLVGCGWSLGGHPIWRGVERLPRGIVRRVRPSGADDRELAPVAELVALFGRGSSPTETAATLVASIRAAADWPGRESIVTVTGGRDSRLVLAGAVGAGIDFVAETTALPHHPGFPETVDVQIARRLCALAGCEHRINLPFVGVDFGYRESMAQLVNASAGTVPLGDIGALAAHASLRIRHTGHAGELGRVPSIFAAGDGEAPIMAAAAAERLTAALLPSLPRPITTAAGNEVITAYMREWTEGHAGLGLSGTDLSNLFYLLERLPNWNAPNQGIYEFTGDSAAPLWGMRMLRHQFGMSSADRRASLITPRVLEALDSPLGPVPYEAELQRRTFTGKVVKELRRRAGARLAAIRGRSGALAGAETMAEEMSHVRELVAGRRRDDPIWDVADRDRVVRLISRHPADLPTRNRNQVRRMATVLMLAP